MQKGWAALIKDNETEAYHYFSLANEKANKEDNTIGKAESLLYLGIATFGSDLEKGLDFATKSLNEYKKIERKEILKSIIGRAKCLQLIATIYSRQNKQAEVIKISHEVISLLKNKKDTSGTLGLAYTNLGDLYKNTKNIDSSEVYYKQALNEFLTSKNSAYLPSAYNKIGEIKQLKNEKEESYFLLNKGLEFAIKTENKQAQVFSWLAISNWFQKMDNNTSKAEDCLEKGYNIAKPLTDKMFEVKAIDALIQIKKKQNNYFEASQWQDKLLTIKNDFFSLEKAKILKNLEVKFDISEKNRKIELILKEKKVSQLTNYLLLIGILVILIIFVMVYFFLKKINKRDKILIKAKEDLLLVLESQEKIKAQQFQDNIENKESQLSIITLQMLQKNELVDELKNTIEQDEVLSKNQLQKIVSKHLSQDNAWNDFNLYFEGINNNFYNRIKQSYPDISPNDLKICALIKLNLSIKQMASILNISPDSVKTARYRLRKKLQLNNEDNLTAFILAL